jgi:DMSO/TMAO reductase YedYZ heme-binding membrane subunit
LLASQVKPAYLSLPALLSALVGSEILARVIAASAIAAVLVIFALAHASFRRARGRSRRALRSVSW